MSYENPWVFEGRTFLSEDINDLYGFVYCITNTKTNRRYIGRKYFWSFRKPPGKKRKVKQESDWKKYYGSCPELKEGPLIKVQLFPNPLISIHVVPVPG